MAKSVEAGGDHDIQELEGFGKALTDLVWLHDAAVGYVKMPAATGGCTAMAAGTMVSRQHRIFRQGLPWEIGDEALDYLS